MPRRGLLTASERASLLAFPETEELLARYYTLSESDLSVISQRRGDHNRLGFAVQLCCLRYPGILLAVETDPPAQVMAFVGRQLQIRSAVWKEYSQQTGTRRKHLLELQTWLKMRSLVTADYPLLVKQLSDLARQTDRGIVLAEALIETLRQQGIIIASLDVIERLCSEALSRGSQQVYEALNKPLSSAQKKALDALLTMREEGGSISNLYWLRQPPGSPKSKNILEHLERLQAINKLGLPEGMERAVHQNRLLKLAREGGRMTSQHLRDFEPLRRYATLAAMVLDMRATLLDEVIDLHDRFVGSLFSRAKRTHADRFQQSGKAINDKVRLYSQIGDALLEAKQSGGDPFAAIEEILPWELFRESVTEAKELSRPNDFDYLGLVGEKYLSLRRYTPRLLEALTLKAAPVARDILKGVEFIKEMNHRDLHRVPDRAPTSFIRKRWENLVYTDEGLDRRFYELCVLTELKNALRSGDIWVQGSRQFKDFEEYLLPLSCYTEQFDRQELGLAIETDCSLYLKARLALLEEKLASAERKAAADELPDASINSHGDLKISPLETIVPDEAKLLIQQVSGMLPHLRITELLQEVDNWTGFTRHFTHLKSGETAQDKTLLLTVVLADAINLGLSKMAEACPGMTYAKLTWLQAWHIRDEAYSAALAELVNAQSHQPFAAYWGDGTTSSSDGQNFKTRGRGLFTGQVNLKYGQEPGVQFYTHISDQYAPFHTKVIDATIRDATHVLDGLLHHESDLRIEEHYTDTAGFTDHVFALMHFLGVRFIPRIRDLSDKRLYIHGEAKDYPTLARMIGGTVNVKHIRDHWDDILRLASSIRQGTVSASLMLRKLGSYPRQNGIAVALREIGRLERTLFTLDWMQDAGLRRRSHTGLNKGEAEHSLARAVFANRLGEVRDRSFEDQSYRASGLNLVAAAIILWNTVYLERVVLSLKKKGQKIDPELLPHISPLGWEHINLTGDYVWRQLIYGERGKFRPLRTQAE